MLQNNHAITCPHCGTHLQSVGSQKDYEPLRRKASEMIARHILFSLQIKQGTDLITLLGTGFERDNFEAIAFWISLRVEKLSTWPISGNDAIIFIEELERELKSILSDASMRVM